MKKVIQNIFVLITILLLITSCSLKIVESAHTIQIKDAINNSIKVFDKSDLLKLVTNKNDGEFTVLHTHSSLSQILNNILYLNVGVEDDVTVLGYIVIHFDSMAEEYFPLNIKGGDLIFNSCNEQVAYTNTGGIRDYIDAKQFLIKNKQTINMINIRTKETNEIISDNNWKSIFWDNNTIKWKINPTTASSGQS